MAANDVLDPVRPGPSRSCGDALSHQRQLLAARLADERRLAAVEDELLDILLADAEPGEVARLLATRLGVECSIALGGKPPMSCDSVGQAVEPSPLVDDASPASAWLLGELADREPGHPRLVGPNPQVGIRNQWLVARLPRGFDGLLVLGVSDHPVTQADARLARRVAHLIALAQHGRQDDNDTGERAIESLVRDAVYGSDESGALRRRAAAAGIALETPAVVAVVGAAGGPDAGAVAPTVAVVRHLTGELRLKHLRRIAGVPSGVVILAALGDHPHRPGVAAVAAELRRLVDAWPSPECAPMAVVSSVCRSVNELSRGLRECDEIRGALAAFETPGRRVMCADDLGPARLLLGQVPVDAARRLAEDTFGALRDQDGRKLLETLAAFLAEGHLVRATATRLDIHENTVRYRLRKLADLTGLDVLGQPDDQLTARLALTVLKLRNSPITKDYA